MNSLSFPTSRRWPEVENAVILLDVPPFLHSHPLCPDSRRVKVKVFQSQSLCPGSHFHSTPQESSSIGGPIFPWFFNQLSPAHLQTSASAFILSRAPSTVTRPRGTPTSLASSPRIQLSSEPCWLWVLSNYSLSLSSPPPKFRSTFPSFLDGCHSIQPTCFIWL